MINSFEELKTISQDFYCIVFRGTVDGVSRLCYLQYHGKPLFFYDYEQAKKYFDMCEIATQNDSWFFWKKGALNYPDAKIVKATLTNFRLDS